LRNKTLPYLLTGKLLVILAAFLFANASPAQDLGFMSYKLQEDNHSFKVNTLFKNLDGYIYAGTTNGLYAFDGINFRRVLFSRSPARDTVTAIFQDHNRVMWVGFKNGRLARLINNKLEYFQPEEGTPAVAITSFAQDKQHNLWFATNGEGVYYFSNNHLYLFDSADGLSDLHVRKLVATEKGDMLAATDQGINILRLVDSKKRVEVIGPKNGLPDYYVTAITPAGNDRYWIGLQEKGFCLYDHPAGKIGIPPAAVNWTYGQVNDLLFAQDNLWIASEEFGLFRQQRFGDALVPFSNGAYFQNKINNLLQDNEGNIWMNSPTELLATAGTKLRLLPVYDQSVFETIHAALCDYQNNIWVSTNAGLIRYSRSDKGFIENRYPIRGLNPNTDITSLYQDIHHHIWIGTMGSGILILDPETGRYRGLDENPLQKNASILSITGGGNTVCAGGLEGAAMIFNIRPENRELNAPYQYTNYNNINNIGNNYIYSIFKDSRGRIWFGTDGKGITVLENGKFTRIDKESGLKDDHIYSFTEDREGNIWFNTEGAGIYRYDGKSFKNYSTADGISDPRIVALKTGPYGNIILVQRNGLDILDVKRGTVSYLNAKQGIADINTDVGAVSQDSSGNLVVSTAAGILIYTPVKDAVLHPKTVIENVQLFLTDIDKEKKGEFSYDQNSFLFNFTGIYYTNPEEVRYQYRLDGLDTTWIMTRDRSVSFLRLQPGTYVFHVRSSLNESFEGADEATYTFVIAKPLWKRYWFILLCILAGGGLVYGYTRSRIRHNNKMQQLQREKIEFQFQVLRSQVNPHFLFNSFNTLISTIEDDPAMAVGYVEQLSVFFRNIVNYRDKDIISLNEELGVVQTYFYLQQKRYGDNLKLEVDIPEAVKKHTFIPPLTLQLLVENAIKHNAISRETPLSIRLFAEHDKQLVIRNNINPKISKEPSSGMGLQNIINRYNLLSDDPVSVQDDGRFFTVTLPILKQMNDESTDH